MSGVPLTLAIGRCRDLLERAEVAPTALNVAAAGLALHTCATVFQGHGHRVPGFGEIPSPVIVALETTDGPWSQELPSEAAAHRFLAGRLGRSPRVLVAHIGGRLAVGEPTAPGQLMPAYPVFSEVFPLFPLEVSDGRV